MHRSTIEAVRLVYAVALFGALALAASGQNQSAASTPQPKPAKRRFSENAANRNLAGAPACGRYGVSYSVHLDENLMLPLSVSKPKK